MSETLDPNIGSLTPEQLAEYQAGSIRPLTIPLGKYAAAAGSLIMPDTNLPGYAAKIPGVGIGEQALGLIDTLTRLPAAGQDYLADKLGIPLLKSQPTPDSVKTAEQNLAATRQKLYEKTGAPPVDPNNPVEQVLAAAGEGAGSFPPLPGAAGLIARLPSAAQRIAGFVLPSTEGAGANAVIGAALGGTGETLGQVADAVEPKPGAVAPTPVVAQPKPDAVAQPTVPTPPLSLDQALTVPAQAPTFSAQGESGIQWWHELAAAATLVGGLVAGKYMHSLGSRVTEADLNARMTNPEYVQAAQDYNDAQLRAKGTVSSNDAPVPPVPASSNVVANAMKRTSTAIRQATVDQTANAKSYVEATSENPTAYESLQRTIGDAYNQPKQGASTREFLKTGVSPNGYKVEVPEALYKDRAALTPDQVKLLNEGLESKDELDTRLMNKQKAGLNPLTQTPADMRLKFKDVDDSELFANGARMASDPQVADIAARYKQLVSDLPKMLNYEGALPTKDMQEVLRTRPNYVPSTDIHGKTSGVIAPRDPTGIQRMNADPFFSLAQHVEQAHQSITQNNFRRGYLEHQDNVQRQFPDSAQWSERVNEANDKEPIITYATPSGWQYRRVNDPTHFSILRKDSPAQAKIQMGAITHMRRIYQRTVTGTTAFFGGKVYAPINPIYTSFQATVNADSRLYRGPIDTALRKATGDRVGTGPFSMIDAPFNLAGSGYAAGRTLWDHAANELSHAFDPKNKNRNVSTQMLSSIITDHQMQQISDTLRDYYLRTATHQDRLGGAGGSGLSLRADLPTGRGGPSMRQVQMIANELVPELFVGGARGKLVRLRRAVDEVFNDIGDSGHSWLNRLNANNPNLSPEERISQIRGITGDPGRQPGNKGVRGVAQALPYTNVSMQGIASSIKPLVERPIGTSIKLLTGLGMLHAFSMYTAMHSPETMNDYENMSAQQGAAFVPFYLGSGISKIMLPSPQEWHFLNPLMKDFVSKLFNFSAAHHSQDVFSGMADMIEELLHSHIENNTFTAMRHGISDAVNFLNVPPILNVPLAPTGKKLNIDIERMYERAQTPGLLNSWDTVLQNTGTYKPGTNEVNGPLEGNNAKVFNNMMESAFGIAGSVFETVTGFHKHYAQGDGFWDALGKTGHDWLQRAKDMNPAMNHILFENELRLTSNPPNVEQVENTLAAMKQLQGARTAEKLEGFTGAKGLPTAPDPTADKKVPTDPTMRQMYFTAAREYDYIESRMKPDINNLRTQMHSYENQGGPAEVRSFINDKQREIADKYVGIQERINVLNMQLSQMAHAQVDVRRVDWQKGVDQFH